MLDNDLLYGILIISIQEIDTMMNSSIANDNTKMVLLKNEYKSQSRYIENIEMEIKKSINLGFFDCFSEIYTNNDDCIDMKKYLESMGYICGIRTYKGEVDTYDLHITWRS